jgi:hypothetical protein
MQRVVRRPSDALDRGGPGQAARVEDDRVVATAVTFQISLTCGLSSLNRRRFASNCRVIRRMRVKRRAHLRGTIVYQ